MIDTDEARCFVLPLNRTMVKPPKDFWDLLSKLRVGISLISYSYSSFRMLQSNFASVISAKVHILTNCMYIFVYHRLGITYLTLKLCERNIEF